MKSNTLSTYLLAVIAVALVAIALRPYLTPNSAFAQTTSSHDFYIEPGVQMLPLPDAHGQVWGKMMIDLRTGTVWGFPTYATDPFPSPANLSDKRPITSHPFVVGKFAFDETDK